MLTIVLTFFIKAFLKHEIYIFIKFCITKENYAKYKMKWSGLYKPMIS